MTISEARKKNILLHYQEAWLLDESKVKVWQKSRRIGASYVEALFSVLKASLKKTDGGMSCYYISYSKDMTQQFVKDVAYWANLFNIACEDLGESVIKDEGNDITIYKVRFDSGFEVWGLPSVPRSIRSKQGHIIIDEAAFCEDLDELLKASLAMPMWGGSVSILSTHNSEDNAFNVLVNEIVDGKKDYKLFSTNIEEAIEGGLYERICEVSKIKYKKKNEALWLEQLKKDYGDAYEEELYCIPSRSGQKYFSRSLLETVKDKEAKVFRFFERDDFIFKSEIERSRKVFDWFNEVKYIFENVKHEVVLGEDFGRSGDLTALWFDEVIKDDKTSTLCVIEMKNVPFSNQENFIKMCLLTLGKKFLGAALDARGNGQMIAENLSIEHRGIILNVMLSRKWYADVFPRLKNMIEDGNTTIANDDLIVNDFLTAEIFAGIPLVRERTGRGATQRHGDTLIAKLMCVYALNELTDKRYQAMTYEAVGTENRFRAKGNQIWD